MELQQLYRLARNEYSHDVCIGLCAAHAIHLSLPIKLRDIAKTGRFREKVEKKIRKALWQETELDLIVRLCFAVYEVEMSQVMRGMGGCTPKTFSDVISENCTNEYEFTQNGSKRDGE